MYRPRVGTLGAKWLEKLKQEKDFKAATRFIKRNIGKYYKATEQHKKSPSKKITNK